MFSHHEVVLREVDPRRIRAVEISPGLVRDTPSNANFHCFSASVNSVKASLLALPERGRCARLSTEARVQVQRDRRAEREGPRGDDIGPGTT